MWYASIIELVALGDESVAPVKIQRMGLCIEHDFLQVFGLCHFHQFLQQLRTDATTAPGFENGHAPDVAIGQQAPRADSFGVISVGNGMDATSVQPIPFELWRNVLLAHENGFAQAAQLRLVTLPVGQNDPNIGSAHQFVSR